MKATKWEEDCSDFSCNAKSITLKDGFTDRILSVTKDANKIIFMEECDRYFSVEFTKEEALKVVDELREWILTI